MLFDVRVDVFEEVIFFDTDDELAWVPAQCCLVIADFHFDGGGIAFIESGDDLQQGCCVINALGHGADVVQSPRQREASIFGNQAMGWFQTDESTGGRRNTDRASGVCTECGKDISDATAAPEPPEDPPGTLSRSHGLWTGPKCGLLLSMPHAYSCMLSLPTSTIPASFMRLTTLASSSETNSSWILDAMVETSPPM